MSVCIYSVYGVLWVQVAALRRADPRPRSSTDSVNIKNLKSGQGPSKGCRALGR
jgi:hypothetical protein